MVWGVSTDRSKKEIDSRHQTPNKAKDNNREVTGRTTSAKPVRRCSDSLASLTRSPVSSAGRACGCRGVMPRSRTVSIHDSLALQRSRWGGM